MATIIILTVKNYSVKYCPADSILVYNFKFHMAESVLTHRLGFDAHGFDSAIRF